MANISQGEVVHGHLSRIRGLANELEIEPDLFEQQSSAAPDDTIPAPPIV
jgi:hypothetical protein